MSAGMLDASFNPAGNPPGTDVVLSSSESISYSGVVQPSGKIVLAGQSQGSTDVVVTLAEFDGNGTLDLSFGSGGIVQTSKWRLPGFGGAGVTAVLYPTGSTGDEQILVAGPAWSSTFALARYNTNGSLDTSFGSNGVASAGLDVSGGGVLNDDTDVLLQPNGDIVQIGTSRATTGKYGSNHDVFGIARFLPSEPQIGSFTANQVMAGGPVTLTASNISDGNPNSSISQVTFYYDSSGNKIIVGTATVPDGSGNWMMNASLPPSSYTLHAQPTDSYGVLGDPLAFSLAVQ